MATESQWVTFRVGAETFGFEIEYVKEMLRLPDVHAVPRAGADNLGVILLRSEVIPVFDLRKKFGMADMKKKGEELIQILAARQQDHENWLNELRRCAHEGEPFTLTTDPHKCKFGQWYDTFQCEDMNICRAFARFDEPHKEIHAIGAKVVAMQNLKQFSEAKALVDSASCVLSKLIGVFADIISNVADKMRQSLIVVGTSARTIGVAVDEISAVVRCVDSEIQAPDSIPGIEQFGGLVGLLPQKGSDKFTMLLDPPQIYPQLITKMKEAAATA